MNIIITGTSSGIGEKILKELSKDLKNNILTISRTENSITADNIKSIKTDLTDISKIEDILDEINKFKCDILINNAGSGAVIDLEEFDIEQASTELLLNLIIPMKLTAIVGKNMKKNNFGRIINISSISGVTGTPYLFTYSASKAGLINFTKSSAEYFKGKNILVNCICPGGIETDMAINGRKKLSKLHGMKEEEYQKNMLKSMGRKKLINPQEVYNLIDYLIHADSVNGQCINVCGLIER